MVQFEYGSNVVKLGTIKWSGSRHPLNGPRFYANAISSFESEHESENESEHGSEHESEHDFEEIISKIGIPDIGDGEDTFPVEVSILNGDLSILY